MSFVKKERSDLESKMTKSLGFAMGIEFREGSLLISAKAGAKAKKGEIRKKSCFMFHINFID